MTNDYPKKLGKNILARNVSSIATQWVYLHTLVNVAMFEWLICNRWDPMIHKHMPHFQFIIAKKSVLLQLVHLIIIFQNQLHVLFSVFCYLVLYISKCQSIYVDPRIYTYSAIPFAIFLSYRLICYEPHFCRGKMKLKEFMFIDWNTLVSSSDQGIRAAVTANFATRNRRNSTNH